MDFEKLVNAFETAGCKVRSYSGRGMYGNECLGVSGGSAISIVLDTLAAFCLLSESKDEIAELIDILCDYRTDQLGRGEILYFPNIEWERDEDES